MIVYTTCKSNNIFHYPVNKRMGAVGGHGFIGRWPLHDCQIIFQHLIRRFEAQTDLYNIIGFFVICCQLFSAIFQAVHFHVLVKSLCINSMLALNLTVMSGSCNSNAVIDDSLSAQFFLK